MGIRAFVAPLMGDMETKFSIARAPAASSPPQFTPPCDKEVTAKLLSVLKQLASDVHGEGSNKEARQDPNGNLIVQMGVGPTGVQLASKELYEGCVAISNEYNLARHTHLLETK